MNKISILFLFASIVSFCADIKYTVTDTRTNEVRTIIDQPCKLFWTWNDTPLTIDYSSLDERVCLHQSVETMLNNAVNGWYGRALDNAESILVVIPRNSKNATILTTAKIEDDEFDSGDGVCFEHKIE